jgi:TRAP-type C4-dicarboxylate transport system substrate-binding protein
MGAAVTVSETRKRGMVALQDEIHRKKLGITLLGALWSGDHHVILVKKALPKADLSGLKIRAIAVQQPAVRTMGGTVTVIPPEEAYTALQSGLLDGIASPSALVPDYRYDEIAKYIFYPLIPMTSWVPVLVKADLWDGLPQDVKKMIMDTLLEMEPQVDPFFAKMEKDIIDNLLKKGLKKTGAATEAEDKEVTKKAVRAQWKAFVEDRADPAWLPRLNAIAKPALGID